MQIIESLESIGDSLSRCCLTIGNFDGVHLGHKKIISAARDVADKDGLKTVVAMTFEPHPVAILHPEKKPQVLTPLKYKAHLLAKAGVDVLIVIRDSYKMLTLSPEDFVDNFLVKYITPSIIVEGRDFHFGYGRSGNIHKLEKLGTERNYKTVIVDDEQIQLYKDSKTKVSSTNLRHLLAKGMVSTACLALGRDYRLMGKVVPGRGIGRKLGFPTANINPHNQIIPAEGVYAGWVVATESDEQLCGLPAKMPAIFSLGRAKTFMSEHPLLIEAHILTDEKIDVYDKYLAMDFVEHIRGQQRFKDEEQLKSQIKKDCQTAKDILGLL